jgi:asparagine synthase (glutamine-hydrolysing)
MLDLFAITGRAAESPVRTHHRKYYKECRRRDVYMRIEGDEPVNTFFLDAPEWSLICCADLLEPDSVTNVAAHLGGLYCAQGDQFVCGLHGTFAIILYDHNQRTLKAWTDHFGAERLVFRECYESLLVGTNLQSIAAHRPRPSISSAAIQEYLLYTCIPTPHAIYQGISKVPPGHQLVSRPAIRTHRYWDIAYDESSDLPPQESTWVSQTQEEVRSAVALSLKNVAASNTTGCFLSGGTDSSSIAGFVGRLTAKSPQTFSIGFDDPRYNEIQYARIAAKHFSADHHEYFVKPEDIPAVVQQAAQVYDEPFGNSSIVPTYYCARLAADHGVTHLLAGDGGDELFGGNSRYVADRVFQRYSRIPPWVRQSVIEPGVSRAARWTRLRFANLAASYVRRSNVPVPDRYFSYSFISSVPGRELFTTDFLAAVDGVDPLVAARSHFNSAPASSELNRWLYLDLKITIADNDLRKVMTMSRLAGVTPRFPFLNPTLAEFTGRIPVNLKVRGSRLRYVFKKAMEEHLPQQIIIKRKHGFGLPYSMWLAESRSLRDFTFDILDSVQCRQRGYFRPGLLDWLWSQYESVHRVYYGEVLWMLLMLELWHVNHADTQAGEEQRPILDHCALQGSPERSRPASASHLN